MTVQEVGVARSNEAAGVEVAEATKNRTVHNITAATVEIK